MGLRVALRVASAALAASIFGHAAPAAAQIGSERYAAIVMDHRTGAVLTSASPDETRHPASLTKMMTLYMVFEALRDGRLTLTTPIVMSAEAASRPPSKIGIPAGQSISVEGAILALVTRSANDVAAAVGERLGGSEERFAQLMTMRARQLGMTRTTFRNASGLPDLDQVTTARDMATLGRRLLNDFPQFYPYFGVTNAVVRGASLRNHNGMLRTYEGVDGIKTGYIRDSGFNIVTSASRGGQRLVGAVFGGSSWSERDAHMAALLDEGFGRLGVPVASGERRDTGVMRVAEAAEPRRGARATPAPSRQASTPVRAAPQRQAALGARTAPASRQPAVTRPAVAATPQRQPSPQVRQATAGRSGGGQARPATPPPPPPPASPGRIRTAELR